jgi:hypothetical protein
MRLVSGARARRRWASAAAVVLLAGLGQAAGTATEAAADGPQATITVDQANPAGSLPADFVGLSYEIRDLGTGNFDPVQGNLPQLFRTLGRSDLRIGGNTLDRDTLWVPEGQQPPDPLPSWVKNTLTPADITRLDHFLAATGWQAQVGINVARFDPALAADQARTLDEVLGNRLRAVMCGNEPNQWVNNGFRTAPYGYPEFHPEWAACADLAGSAPIAGPEVTGSGASWITQLSQDERTRVSMLTQHLYSTSAGATVTQLLSPEIATKQVNSAATAVAAGKAAGIPVRIDETNSTVQGGVKGVSDVYASALWALDYSLAMARSGVSGLNFHGGLGVCGEPLWNGKFQLYTPICAANAADAQAKVYQAAPEYYGLYLASRMGPGQFLPIQLSTDRNVTAYAVRGDDGRTRIAVIEKDPTTSDPVDVGIKVGNATGSAEVVHLTGTSLDSADGVAVEGATVDSSGRLIHRPGDRVPVQQGALNLTVAAGSAVVITLDCS